MLKIKKIELVKTAYVKKELLMDTIPKIVIIGRSNVGKSSLINKLLNRKNLAKTSSKPGKTISINYYFINDKFHLIDLPGYGYAKISKTDTQRIKKLIRDFFENTKNIKLVLLLIDSRRGFTEADTEMLSQFINFELRILTILTKSDKLSNSLLQNKIKTLKQEYGLGVLPFSIRSMRYREELLKYIEKSIKE